MGGTKRLLTNRLQVDHRHVFSITDWFYNRDPNELLTNKLIGFNCFVTDDTRIWGANPNWKEDLVKVKWDDLKLVFRVPPVVGSSVEIGGEHPRSYEFEVAEDVAVLAGMFRACAKLRVEDLGNGEENPGVVWLARGVGVVKFENGTGRVEELFEYEIPE
jgi:hypothetical protein